jgi:hypothetical protein
MPSTHKQDVVMKRHCYFRMVSGAGPLFQ